MWGKRARKAGISTAPGVKEVQCNGSPAQLPRPAVWRPFFWSYQEILGSAVRPQKLSLWKGQKWPIDMNSCRVQICDLCGMNSRQIGIIPPWIALRQPFLAISRCMKSRWIARCRFPMYEIPMDCPWLQNSRCMKSRWIGDSHLYKIWSCFRSFPDAWKGLPCEL